METDIRRSFSSRATRRTDRNNQSQKNKGRFSQDVPMKIIWKRGFIRLALVGGILWMLLILVALLFHVWSCQSSIAFISGICRKDSKVFIKLDNMGLILKQHRCPIPVMDDPNSIVIPERGVPDTIPQKLSYYLVDEHVKAEPQSPPLFGGHQSWKQREDSFKLNSTMKNVSVREDRHGGKWVGIWRIVVLHHPPYDEPRRNGKVPKILTHRLFPEAQYTIWIDGKMELIVDPLLILERYLWRGKHTFAIARHKHHQSIYEEADAIKRRKRYARPLIDLHMKIYRYEGMEPWNPMKNTLSDVPEGAVIIREHTALNDLFSCLWFNEVNLFTPRDQLSFGYVVYRLGRSFKFFMFRNCEYNSLFILHKHTREHSSVVEWVKSLDEFQGNATGLKESRGFRPLDSLPWRPEISCNSTCSKDITSRLMKK